MSSVLRAGMAALRDRSFGVFVAPAAPADGNGDDIPTVPWSAPAPAQWWAAASAADVRRLLVWFAACALVLVLVAVTNPTEGSFRAHLTELAFRRHLAHIRSSDDPETAATGADSLRSSPAAGSVPNSGTSSGADTPPVAPFRFANHVAITLRTPTLSYRSYFFFALAFAAAPGPPAFLSDPPTKSTKASHPAQPEPAMAYLGVLGHWLVLGHVPPLLQWAWRAVRIGRRDRARKKSAALDRAGVLEMRAVLPKDDLTRNPLGPKLSSKDFADLLPLHSHSTPPSVTPCTGSSGGFGPESRQASVVNLMAAAQAAAAPEAPVIEVSSPVLTALKAELAGAQSVLAELQAQLTSHDEAVAAAQAHLQSTLDDLRQRRKEDDAERQDLKSKAKTLEDQKRQAEGARRESEKRLRAVEAVRDGVQTKIAVALSEIQDLKDNMEMSGRHTEMVAAEGARHVEETCAAVEEKNGELADLEREVAELEAWNEALHQQVRDAEDRLKTAEAAADDARKMAPEEEMMLMAAAYEAVASESYLHGQRQNQADTQWASQAAAYMAEAGFPHLDQSYTARPQTISSGFGHLARATPPQQASTSTSTTTTSTTFRAPGTGIDKVPTSILAAADKLPDVPGFEDFGPGAGATRSLAPLAPLRTTTPQPLTARTTVEPEDLGSPSGPISASFSNSWLPQGLVRSLEGDVTPHESAFDNADLPFIADGRASSDADSDSDSGGDSPPWQRNPAVQRFIPGTSSPHMGGSTGTLPGTAAGNSNANSLQSSRRWFSTSPSSENVSTGFNLNLFSSHGHVHAPSGVVGSSDSLPLGFESPFAPSASEKRALKWPLLGKARWGSSGNGNGLDEITAGLRETSSTPPLGSSPDPAYNATGLSAEELFNRVPVPVTSASAGWYSSARSYNGIGNSVGNGAGNGGKDNGSVNGQFGLTAAHRHSPPHDSNTDHPAVNAAAAGASTDEVVLEGGGMPGMPAAERKASFRFFSLRKGAAS